jgi:hypothetical protein
MIQAQFQSLLHQDFGDEAGYPLCGEQWTHLKGDVAHDAPAGPALTRNTSNL